MLIQIWALEKKGLSRRKSRKNLFFYYYIFICSANLKYISVWLTCKISLSQQGVIEFLTRLGGAVFCRKVGIAYLAGKDKIGRYC